MASKIATSVSPAAPPPPPASLTSPWITPKNVGRAVDALLKWNNSKSKNQKPQLLEEDDFLYLILTLKKIPPKGRTNPYKISLPHSLHPFDSSEELCLIIDDRLKSSLSSESAKKKIESESIPISKVLKLSKLKTDYRPFEAKRKLCSSYDFFFADKRVIPLLPRLLGKEFFKKKKIPVPVDLTHKNWKAQIENACGSALLYLRTGTCSVIKVARVSMERDEIVENVVAAIEGAVEIVPKKWVNVRSLHLKLSESLALPVYQSVPDVGLKIEGVKKVEESKEEELEEGKVEEKDKKLGKKKGSKKGRIHEIRYMDSDLDEALDDLSEKENENGELDSTELSGKKRKKEGSSKKEKVLDGSNGENKLKKPVKVKKGDAVKQKGVEVENEINGEKKLKKPEKGDAVKQKGGEVENEINGEKKPKKPVKVKKGYAVKQKGEKVENEIDIYVSSEVKKKKKTSKIEKSESGEMKNKKSKITKAKSDSF